MDFPLIKLYQVNGGQWTVISMYIYIYIFLTYINLFKVAVLVQLSARWKHVLCNSIFWD